MLNENESIKSSIGGGAPQQPDYIWVSGPCSAKTPAPCARKLTEVNMTETNFEKHASLRGTNAVSHEPPQLAEFQRGQSTSVTTLTDFAAFNRLGCRAHIRSLAMTQSVAFTMAEILLSLTIIGVVAAITLPSLMANINERTWNTQRKALYARMSQAIAMMPQLNGYGKVTEEGGSVIEDTAAEAFLTEGLSKVLKINNICDSEHLADCGMPSTIIPINGGDALDVYNEMKNLSGFNNHFVNHSFVGSGWGAGGSDVHYSYSQPDTKAAAFETQNGESVMLHYNPNCLPDPGDQFHYSQPQMCANFIYDLNGNKGPNTVGKDIGFITAMYSIDSNTVAPLPLSENAGMYPQHEASAACVAQDAESRLPNRDELTAMFYNRRLLGLTSGGRFCSGSVVSSGTSGTAWYQSFDAGHRAIDPRNTVRNVRCVKR